MRRMRCIEQDLQFSKMTLIIHKYARKRTSSSQARGWARFPVPYSPFLSMKLYSFWRYKARVKVYLGARHGSDDLLIFFFCGTNPSVAIG